MMYIRVASRVAKRLKAWIIGNQKIQLLPVVLHLKTQVVSDTLSGIVSGNNFLLLDLLKNDWFNNLFDSKEFKTVFS